MTEKLRPTWGYKANNEAQIFVLGEGENLPPGWADSPASVEAEAVPEPQPEPEPEVAGGLPENWRDLHWKQRVKLAKDLTGNLEIVTAEEADAAIEAYLNG